MLATFGRGPKTAQISNYLNFAPNLKYSIYVFFYLKDIDFKVINDSSILLDI